VSVTYFLHICPQFSLGLDEKCSLIFLKSLIEPCHTVHYTPFSSN